MIHVQPAPSTHLLPPCEICGEPARNAYPCSINDKTYDFCDEHLYRFLDYISTMYNDLLQMHLRRKATVAYETTEGMIVPVDECTYSRLMLLRYEDEQLQGKVVA